MLKSESSPAWRSSAKIRRCRGLGRGRRARGASWGSVGSSARLRWRWSVVERRSRGGAGARRGGAARASGARASCGGCEARWGEGVRGGATYRAAANLGVRARGWETGEFLGEDRGRALREDGDGTDRRARAAVRGKATRGWALACGAMLQRGRSVSGGRRRTGRVAGLGERG